MRVAAIIASGGEGKRFSSLEKKQFQDLFGRPVLAHSTYPFQKSDLINEIVLVVPEEDLEFTREKVVNPFGLTKVSSIVAGGTKRQDSVFNGLSNLKNEPDFVFIHDGVRPFVKIEEIEKAFLEVEKYGAVIFAIPARNTIKKVDSTKNVMKTFSRDELWEAQTPQIFRYDWILEAFKRAFDENYYATDESTLIERVGHCVKVFPCSPENIKITYPVDLKLAQGILGEWRY